MTVSNTTAAVFTFASFPLLVILSSCTGRWFLDLASIGALANYSWMMLTYIRTLSLPLSQCTSDMLLGFHKATKAQGTILPFKGVFMPWGAYIALFFLLLIM